MKKSRLIALLLTMVLMLTSMVTVAYADEGQAPEGQISAAADEFDFDDAEDGIITGEDLANLDAEEAVQAGDAAADEDLPAEAGAVEEEVEAVLDVSKSAGTPKLAGTKYTDSQLGINSTVAKQLKDWRCILIMGLDNGNRADIMIVFCYKKSSGTAKIFSVARDTYMQLNNSTTYTVDGKKRDFCKGNRAYKYGGELALMKELNRHLDLNIRECIGIDWATTAKLIDKMGGLKNANVDKKMLSWINSGAGMPADVLKSGEYKIKSGGKQTLKGWQAVQYLRVRKYDGGSARVREARNRGVFTQLFNQARGMTLAQVLGVYDYIKGDLDTNMDEGALKSALGIIAATSSRKTPALTNTANFPYKSKSYWDPDGLYVYLVPNSLASNVTTLHKNIFGQNKYKPSSTCKSLSSKIVTKTKKYLKTKQPKFTSAKVTVASVKFDGASHSAKPVVRLGDRTLTEGKDYTVSGTRTATNAGSYKLTISGAGSTYAGKITRYFNIIPAGTGGLKLTAGKKAFTAKWNAQTQTLTDANITGYQIQYSLKKNFSGAKTKTVNGYKSVSTTVSKLKGKKVYYVRVRTFIKNGGGTAYSAWSGTAKIKIKK